MGENRIVDLCAQDRPVQVARFKSSGDHVDLAWLPCLRFHGYIQIMA